MRESFSFSPMAFTLWVPAIKPGSNGQFVFSFRGCTFGIDGCLQNVGLYVCRMRRSDYNLRKLTFQFRSIIMLVALLYCYNYDVEIVIILFCYYFSDSGKSISMHFVCLTRE